MIRTTLPAETDPERDTWLGVEPDVYLDARRASWGVHEAAGLVRYMRPSGERRGRLRVAPAAAEIIAVLAPLAAERA